MAATASFRMPPLVTIKPLLRMLPPVLLVLLCLLVFFPGLSGGFLFDDFPNIVTNKKLQASTLTIDSLAVAARAYEPGTYGRPLATLGFAVDFALGGKDPWGYKVHSLAVHILNSLLIYLLALRLLALPRAGGPWPRWVPLFLAALWAVHPLQISSVLYIVQRMELVSLTFVLLGLLAYLRGRQKQRDGLPGGLWLLGSALLAGVGMLSKETAALFPAYALALELTMLRFEAANPRTRAALKAGFAAGVALAILVFFSWLLPRYLAPEAYSLRDFTLAERLLTQLRVLPMYLGQILLPLPGSLLFYYDAFPKSVGWLQPPTTLAGGVLLLCLLGAAWRLRQRAALASLGILWFFASHLITSNVINLELAFEHRNYFAVFGVLLAAAALLRRLPIAPDSRLPQIAAIAVLVGFSALGAVRAATWGHPLVLASDLVARSPLSPRASSDLATLYVAMSDSNPASPFFSFGQREFERGARLPNASPLPEQGLILMAATTGGTVDDAWWDSLIEKLRIRPIGPQELRAVTSLMQQRYEGIEVGDARLSEAYAMLLSRRPLPAEFYLQYADFSLTFLKDEALAEQLYLDALQGTDMTPEYAARVMAALALDGRDRQLQSFAKRARELELIAQ